MESPYFRIRKSRYSAGFSIATASVFYIWISTVNDCSTARYWWCAVAYPTKILFWKRITACYQIAAKWEGLLLILQRYYFESESQQSDNWSVKPLRCCLSYKDTILKANHSHAINDIILGQAVAYPTKILFWKRITACWRLYLSNWTLLLILQRYYFESESQLNIHTGSPSIRCCLSYKDTILKANHSHTLVDLPWLRSCCLSYKDTILKANHSWIPSTTFLHKAVAYPTKILFWKRITAL